MEPPWEEGTSIYKNGFNRMIKMATMGTLLIFSKTLSPKSPMIMKLGMDHWGIKLYKVYTCINDNSTLNLAYFTAMSYLNSYVFEL